MKTFLILTFLLVTSFISRAVCRADLINITSYKIKLDYAGNKQFKIQAEVTLYKGSLDKRIFFLVDTNETFTNVELAENKNYLDLPYVKNTDTLWLQIPSTYIGKRQLHLLFTYTLTFDSLSRGVKTMGSWYPYLFNNISRFNIIAKMPPDYMMFFPGVLLKKSFESKNIKCIWEMDKAIPRLFFVIAKTNAYTVSRSVINGKALNFYFLTKDNDLLHRFKSESLKAFKFFNNYIGNYRYKNLTFIEVPDISYINSQPSFIMMGSVFLDYYKKNLYDWPPHEIAHQWFGSGTFSKHNDLNSWCIFEPLAEYLRLTFTASDSGKVYMENEIKGMVDEYKSDYMGKPQDKPLIESGSSRVTYIKGTYVMNKIAGMLGQRKWQEFLEKLNDHFQGRFLTYSDFIKYLSKINNNAGKAANEMFTTTGLIKK